MSTQKTPGSPDVYGHADLHGDLIALASRVEIQSADSCLVDGESCELEGLNHALYRLFCRLQPASFPVDRKARREHIARLSAVNTGSGTWEPDWRVSELESRGRVGVERDGICFGVNRKEVRCPNGKEPLADARVRVRVPEERQWAPAEFYVALGAADPAPIADLSRIVRLYWNLSAAIAVDWVRSIVSELNQRQVAFILKVPSAPRDYRRADAGVLYLEPESLSAAWPVVEKVYAEVADGLCSEAPLLTLPLAPGLSLAEGDPDGSSFGEQRCRWIARALREAFENGDDTISERCSAVARAFSDRGIDPGRPHLAPAEKTEYPPIQLSKPAPHQDSSAKTPSVPDESPGFLEAAVRIGEGLVAQAFWSERACNWVGRCTSERSRLTRRVNPTVRSLSAELHGGTAGVGLFLAEIYQAARVAPMAAPIGSVTAESLRQIRQAAVGALEHSLESVRPAGYEARSYLYGRLGVAWSVLRVGELTKMPGLVREGRAILATCVENFADTDCIGNAGAIPVLAELYRKTGETFLLEGAIELGATLVKSADRSGPLWSWPNRSTVGFARNQPPLTGLSLGASGIGLALLELFELTGRAEFCEAARGAFGYEDSCFDPEHRNWPDFRPVYRRGSGEWGSADRFQVAWCHGAPGVALARLRAIRLDPDHTEKHEAVARAALATTRDTLIDRLEDPDADCSLCHGLSGLIEVLLYGSEILDDREMGDLGKNVMGELFDRHAESGEWPSGVPSRGPNPSLFLGTAGVGYTLLRLSKASGIRSVLLPSGHSDQGAETE